MKDKKNVVLFMGVLLILLFGIGMYLYTNSNREYKYICLDRDLYLDQPIIEDYLKECVSKERLSEGVITDKDELLDIINDNYKSYWIAIDKVEEGEMLYIDYFKIYERPKATSEDIQLLTELKILDHGSGSDDMETYRVYIEDKKLYAKNENTGEVRIIFQEEEVKNIALRGLCCAGDSRMLILTMDGDVYISVKNATYSFSFDSDFPFDKLDVSNVVGFKLVPVDDVSYVKDLYIIDSNGNEIKVDDSDYRL